MSRRNQALRDLSAQALHHLQRFPQLVSPLLDGVFEGFLVLFLDSNKAVVPDRLFNSQAKVIRAPGFENKIECPSLDCIECNVEVGE
ncbi:MAG TPA: hypothetical protein VMV68_05015, partial [Spirochaetia bacterium]|nr:hypothetical protein [Spirochaetia bacterium]